MADIQFEEEQQYQQPSQVENKPFFIRLVLATGIVSTDRDAEYVLIGFVVVAILAALFVIPFLLGPKTEKPILRPGVPISPPMLNT